MFNATECACWTSSALSHYQKIEIFTKITQHNKIYAESVKTALYCVLFTDIAMFVLLQNCAIMQRLLKTGWSCSGDVKNCCGFLSRSSHDMASNTVSHGMQKYPVD